MKQTEWYTLKIQYPITKADIEIIYKSKKSMCWLYEHDGTKINHLDTGGLPESWLVPIEDKAMTAEESLKEWGGVSVLEHNRIKKTYIEAFKAGEKNQWINHGELKKLINEFIECFKDGDKADGYYFENRFREALKNIKPVEEI